MKNNVLSTLFIPAAVARSMKVVIPVTVLVILLVAAVLTYSTGRDVSAQASPIQAVVLTDHGAYDGVVSAMGSLGWAVSTLSTLETELAGESVAGLGTIGDLSSADVVWIPWGTNESGLHLLVGDGGSLDVYVRGGGIVVVSGITTDGYIMLDVAPGGTDVDPIPEGGSGAVTITAIDHPFITGAGTGGTALTSSDLDPTSSGGGGCITNVPNAEGCTVIAENSDGAVLAIYTFGDGYVVVSTLLNGTAACQENLILYVQSLVQ